MLRDIIQIDEELCNGCGNCVPGCHEGALEIIDGKARLISDLMCDGLGACVGHCPTGAMTVVKREAEEYDERRVMLENIIPAGTNTIAAHLNHLLDHGETQYHKIAVEVLTEKGIDLPQKAGNPAAGGIAVKLHGGSCPGSAMRDFSSRPEKHAAAALESESSQPSALRQWPVQLHLLNPAAPYFRGADVLLAADCTAYALGDFHSRYLKGKSLAIACPKLDQGQESYVAKITAMIDEAKINTLSVMMMEVPCCSSLLATAQKALASANRKIPVKKMIVSLEGQVLSDEWL